jgi:hypothetical protein
MSLNDKFSCIKGYTFSFEDNNNHITAWFSALSGREKVFVNQVLVASNWNLSKNTSNTFAVNDDTYSTSLEVKSLLKGPIICTLIKNSKPYKRKILIFQFGGTKGSKRSFFLRLLPYLILGIVLGFISSHYQIPDIYVLGLILAVVSIHAIYDLKKGIYSKNTVKIVEDEIT